MRIKILIFSMLACCVLVGADWFLSKDKDPAVPEPVTAPQTEIRAFAATRATPEPAPSTWEPPLLAEEVTKQELLQTARRLVAQDVAQTLEWALSLEDPAIRDRLLHGVLQAWGEIDPESAVAWALGSDEDQRFMNLEAALAGAATQPDVALSIVRDLQTRDFETGDRCAAMLIGTFSRVGNFESALTLLTDAPGDAKLNRASSIFNQWGRTQPEAAIEALNAIADPGTYDAAFMALVDGWSGSDPSSLVAYTLGMPLGETRNFALVKALDRWSLQDPAAMADWLSQHIDVPEYDFSTAILLMKSDGANRDIPAAFERVESIRDETFRLIALECVIREWSLSDRLAAEQYVNKSESLTQAQRNSLLESLSIHPPAMESPEE